METTPAQAGGTRAPPLARPPRRPCRRLSTLSVAQDETATPIKQDTKKGKLRFYPYNINW